MNIKLNDGKYYVSDTMSSDGYILLSLAKNPHNIYETRVVNHGKQMGRPTPDMKPIKEEIAMRLLRQQNMRKREQFLGF
jgi:hypothetical protein